MSEPHDPDAQMIEHMRDAYQPGPMSASERAAFDAAVSARIEAHGSHAGRLRLLVPATAGILAAIVLWFVTLQPGTTPKLDSGITSAQGRESLILSAWDYAVLIPSEREDWFNGADEDSEEQLPEEYLAIASAVFGDR